MLLSACTDFCNALEVAVGPQLTEWICIAAIAGLTWWRTRKVHVAAQAGIAVARAEATEARVSLARLEGSLRPSAPAPGEPYAVVEGKLVSSLAPTQPVAKPERADEPAPLEGLTSASGTYQPIRFPELPEGVAKPTATNLVDPKIPRPSAVPKIDNEG